MILSASGYMTFTRYLISSTQSRAVRRSWTLVWFLLHAHDWMLRFIWKFIDIKDILLFNFVSSSSVKEIIIS